MKLRSDIYLMKLKYICTPDGGGWIQKGLEWLPNTKFVLDKYHKNKAIKAMTAGIENKYRNNYDKEIREALNEENLELYDQ